MVGAIIGAVARGAFVGRRDMGGYGGNIILGVAGAVVGGFIGNAIVGVTLTAFSAIGLVLALVGAATVLWIYAASVHKVTHTTGSEV